MLSSDTARPKSQAEDAYEQIRAALLNCRLAPGEKLNITELSAEMGFSPGAVREALSRLTADGLVEAEAQKGFRAARISAEDLADLTRARAGIEALCLGEAIERGDLAWEARVLAAHHRLSRTPMNMKKGATLNEEWLVAHADFHLALAEGCGNRWLLRLRGGLYEQSERYRHMSVPLDPGDRDVAAEHRAICEAALARDKALAVELLRAHIERTTRIILDAIADAPPGFIAPARKPPEKAPQPPKTRRAAKTQTAASRGVTGEP